MRKMEIKQIFVKQPKYPIKCPYSMSPQWIVVHNTANDASAQNEIKYMINNNNQVSFHFAVDDKEIVQGVSLSKNAWHASDGTKANGGNMSGIAIEICYSKSGGARFIEAEKNAAKFIAQLLKERNWGIEHVKKHQDFSGKYCPHRTLDLGWGRFLNMIQVELNASNAVPVSDMAAVEQGAVETLTPIQEEAKKFGLLVATELTAGSQFYISEHATTYGGSSYGVSIPSRIRKAPSKYVSGGQKEQYGKLWVLAKELNSWILVNECLIKK